MTDQMHSLLRRQLKKYFGGAEAVPDDIRPFIEAVNESYVEFDVDREMLERSLELSSQEMLQTNAEMRAILLAIPDIIFRLNASGTILDCEAGGPADFYLVPKNKVVGKKIQDLVFQDVGKKFSEAVKEVQRQKTVIGIEYELDVQSSLNYYEARLVPFLESQIIVIIRNITDRKKADEALRLQEERFRVLIEKATDLITVIDVNGIITYVSPSVKFLLGYEPDEVVGRRLFEYIHPDDTNETVLKMVSRNQVETLELRIRHRDGSWRFLEVVGTELENPDIGDVIINARDITERKLAEAARNLSEILYRAIFDNTGTAMFIVQNGSISLANKKAETLSGYTAKELSSLNHWARLTTREFIESVAANGPAFRAQALSWPRSYEGPLRRKDGSIREVLATVNDIPGAGLVIVSVQDLTEIKEAQTALQESEERYRLIIENSTDGIFIIQDNVIKFPNRHTINTLGYSEEEFAKMHYTAVMHPDDLERAVNTFNHQFRTKSAPSPIVFRVITKSGEELWAEVTAVPTLWKGTPAAINFVRNITQQKKLEEQLLQARKMEAIGTLAGGVAHDFNNLLMGIQGYASIMLMDEDRSESDAEMLKAIEQQVKSGADLTKQLLGFARAGKYELKPTDLNDIIQRTSSIFGRTRKEISIHTNFAYGLWTVEVDKGQIEQCLLNLYVNAWQAMPSGGHLYLATENTEVDADSAAHLDLSPGMHVRISITDTGTGMDKKTQSRIFEPFFTTKEMGRGTGLGLASVYGIVKNHKGVINVTSQKGIGTTFFMYLPASQKALTDEIAMERGLAMGAETILVVEDERIVSQVTESILKKMGYKVLTAGDGKKAIDLYKNNKDEISLVILDMIMPGMGGEETFAALKAADPDVKVVLSSGYSINEKVLALMERGCLEFVQKPFDPSELSWKLRKILDNAGPIN